MNSNIRIIYIKFFKHKKPSIKRILNKIEKTILINDKVLSESMTVHFPDYKNDEILKFYTKVVMNLQSLVKSEIKDNSFKYKKIQKLKQYLVKNK